MSSKKENINLTKSEKNNNFDKIGGFNVVVITIISFLYILLITKLAEIISVKYEEDLEEQIGVYVMIVYFISIIGIIVGYIWFSNNSNGYSTQNWIIRWSLSIGGVLILIHTMINYWEYLNDYCKLLLIFLSITSIIYYLYKYY
jgi:cytochrome bd-type quinol oxidase subunit 2